MTELEQELLDILIELCDKADEDGYVQSNIEFDRARAAIEHASR